MLDGVRLLFREPLGTVRRAQLNCTYTSYEKRQNVTASKLKAHKGPKLTKGPAFPNILLDCTRNPKP